MPRFFYPSELAIGALINLPDTVAHHCQVLRLNAGDPIVLFNGKGGSYVASLTSIEKKRATAEVKTFNQNEVELAYSITLAQALPEASKMDWIIEKAVELGAVGIQPLTTQRCVTRLSGERVEKRRAHWQAIIESASEQCGRNRLAQLGQLADFKSWISQQDLHRRIILSPHSDQSLADWARHHPAQAITLMIGPEGGFTEQEHLLAINQGALSLSMGARVLRTETAGLTAIATVNAFWGGM
ncbi:16S rRNA (uracil(1498)-N(3))-methyltransferase [Solimicrobium silvestre]|uniref:Ribosomal RNA small subunit methyltransferase E n=1 Tax=Solimicrobium silvestre TaxID=2099400 RepID=A0A2S9H4J8_9BURK|nr:16S rRNA (uracil(1498)-N(3))-methyltransferase [Solimicrobium silvestre]PRC94861.1 RNA methyltransferase [Solimicrobium silvestre]